MKHHSFAACLGIVTACALPLAHAQPAARTQTNQLRAAIAEAAGFATTLQGDYSFNAKSYVDFDGSRAGSVFIDSFAFPGGLSFISCTGPEFANAVTMNQSTGVVTVDALIDPSSPNCFAFNYTGAPLALRFAGKPDGNERVSENGNGTQQLFSETFKFNFQSDSFSETFSGSTGLYTGVFTGRATYSRSTNRIKVK